MIAFMAKRSWLRPRASRAGMQPKCSATTSTYACSIGAFSPRAASTPTRVTSARCQRRQDSPLKLASEVADIMGAARQITAAGGYCGVSEFPMLPPVRGDRALMLPADLTSVRSSGLLDGWLRG